MEEEYTLELIESIIHEMGCITCGSREVTLQMYPHPNGIMIEDIENKQWVSIKCGECGDEVALWKVEKRIDDKKLTQILDAIKFI